MNPGIAALVGMASSALNNGLDTIAWQPAQLRNQYVDWKKRFAEQNQRQDFLNQTQFSTLASSARSGGFSPLAALGGQFSGNVANPSSGSLQQTEHADPLAAMAKAVEMENMTAQNNNLLAQNNVLKEEAKVKKEQARAAAIENSRKEAADLWFKEHPTWRLVDVTLDDGTVVQGLETDEIFANQGAFEAAQLRNTYESQRAENQAKHEEANLRAAIAYYRRNNPDAVEAVATMPILDKKQAQAQIANIFKDIEKKNADIENIKAEKLYKELRTRIEGNTNLQELINRLGTDATAIDILLLLTAGDGIHSGAGGDLAAKILDAVISSRLPKLKKGKVPNQKGKKDKDFNSTFDDIETSEWWKRELGE